MAKRQKVYGRRAVLEMLEAGIEIDEIFVLAAGKGDVLNDIRQRAQQASVRVVPANRPDLDRMAPGDVHQGVVAFYAGVALLDLEAMIEQADASKPLVILDGVEDPRNLGAIVRSVEALGGGGVIMRHDRAASLTPSAIKASAGAALHLPIAEVHNIERAMARLKEAEYWTYGLDPSGDKVIWETDLSGKKAFVFGTEGKGLSRLVKDRCDFLIHFPQAGKVASLNVSVTVALTMAESLRQDHKAS